jgi:hypothetical protein
MVADTVSAVRCQVVGFSGDAASLVGNGTVLQRIDSDQRQDCYAEEADILASVVAETINP